MLYEKVNNVFQQHNIIVFRLSGLLSLDNDLYLKLVISCLVRKILYSLSFLQLKCVLVLGLHALYSNRLGSKKSSLQSPERRSRTWEGLRNETSWCSHSKQDTQHRTMGNRVVGMLGIALPLKSFIKLFQIWAKYSSQLK